MALCQKGTQLHFGKLAKWFLQCLSTPFTIFAEDAGWILKENQFSAQLVPEFCCQEIWPRNSEKRVECYAAALTNLEFISFFNVTLWGGGAVGTYVTSALHIKSLLNLAVTSPSKDGKIHVNKGPSKTLQWGANVDRIISNLLCKGDPFYKLGSNSSLGC